MSQSLYWEPMHREKEGLSDELKYALRKKYDGSVHVNMSSHDIPYLEGLRDAGIKDAEVLIQAILRCEWISVTEE